MADGNLTDTQKLLLDLGRLDGKMDLMANAVKENTSKVGVLERILSEHQVTCNQSADRLNSIIAERAEARKARLEEAVWLRRTVIGSMLTVVSALAIGFLSIHLL